MEQCINISFVGDHLQDSNIYAVNKNQNPCFFTSPEKQKETVCQVPTSMLDADPSGLLPFLQFGKHF